MPSRSTDPIAGITKPSGEQRLFYKEDMNKQISLSSLGVTKKGQEISVDCVCEGYVVYANFGDEEEELGTRKYKLSPGSCRFLMIASRFGRYS